MSDVLGLDHPKEECGVLGVSGTGNDAARTAFFGLYALQHRGQEAAGIAVSESKPVVDISKGKMYEVVAEGYSSPVTTICTLREFKNQEKWATGAAPKLVRKRSTGGYFYADEDGNPVLKAVN